MMTHDPMQAYSMLGAYQGVAPYGLPQTLQTSGIHPSAVNPLAVVVPLSSLQQTGGFSQLGQQGYPGIAGYGGIYPQQHFGQPQNPFLQHPLAGIGVQNPWVTAGLQNPLIHPVLQNPLLQNPFIQNPLLQNPAFYPIQAQLPSPFGQGQAQIPPPFGQGTQWGQGGSQLAPQTWVGQGGPFGGGIGYGQVPPFLQYGRGIPMGGINPWTGF